MQADVGAILGKLLISVFLMAVLAMAGWSFYNKRNKFDYMGDLSTSAQLEIELERKLADIAIANIAKTDPWHVHESVSSKDDSPFITLSTGAVTPVSIRGGGYQTPRMVIRCAENVTSILVVFETFIGSRERIVESRVDETRLQRATWAASSDNKTVGLWRGAQAIPFIKSLLHGESLTLWMTPHNASGVAVTFNIKSLERHLGKVSAACGWSFT